MQFYSLNHKAPKVSFKEAVIKGIAPDKGLYFPESISRIDQKIIDHIEDYSNHELGFELIKQFVGEDIPEGDLKSIIEDTLNFDFPIISIEKDVYCLELFHGPTMAFKDVGGRFMARCLSYFNKKKTTDITVLVATSGDTGGAVASGFLGVKGVNVVILYPSGKVSDVQEKQLTTLGQNIKALEVDGTFDDCQAMVKTAFLDGEITDNIQLTSANSINVARWLPQMFYFAFAFKQLKDKTKRLVFSTPSGNFGNICAGFMAQQLSLPIDHFIAATNANRVVPNFMVSGKYEPIKSVATISNAMDVGDPSNFIRIREIFKNNFSKIQKNLSSYSYSDYQTREAMKDVYSATQYVMDPHGAVGYLGLKQYLKEHDKAQGVFLETAHPIKFLDVVEPVIQKSIPFPTQIEEIMDREKVATSIKSYDELKAFLLN